MPDGCLGHNVPFAELLLRGFAGSIYHQERVDLAIVGLQASPHSYADGGIAQFVNSL